MLPTDYRVPHILPEGMCWWQHTPHNIGSKISELCWFILVYIRDYLTMGILDHRIRKFKCFVSRYSLNKKLLQLRAEDVFSFFCDKSVSYAARSKTKSGHLSSAEMTLSKTLIDKDCSYHKSVNGYYLYFSLIY